MLLLFKPFQVGDYIIQDQAGGTEGTVYKVEMFYTTLITIDNKHVIIPNGKLSNSTIINVTAQNLRNLEIKVGISYDSDIKKAKKLLQDGYKVHEVSELVGYNNYRYFCDIFKKHEGMTPNEYKGNVWNPEG